MCRTHDSAMQTQGHSNSSRSWDLPLNFASAPYLLNPLKDFHKTLVKSHDSMSMSQFEVMDFTLQICVHSIFPESFERFSLNFGQISVRWCASISQYGFKDKIKGHGVLLLILCLLPIPLDRTLDSVMQSCEC